MLFYKKTKHFCENIQYHLVIPSELVTKSCKYGKVVSVKCLTTYTLPPKSLPSLWPRNQKIPITWQQRLKKPGKWPCLIHSFYRWIIWARGVKWLAHNDRVKSRLQGSYPPIMCCSSCAAPEFPLAGVSEVRVKISGVPPQLHTGITRENSHYLTVRNGQYSTKEFSFENYFSFPSKVGHFSLQNQTWKVPLNSESHGVIFYNSSNLSWWQA